jgi:hypothetical protein
MNEKWAKNANREQPYSTMKINRNLFGNQESKLEFQAPRLGAASKSVTPSGKNCHAYWKTKAWMHTRSRILMPEIRIHP